LKEIQQTHCCERLFVSIEGYERKGKVAYGQEPRSKSQIGEEMSVMDGNNPVSLSIANQQ
jgi:hypothetical protein